MALQKSLASFENELVKAKEKDEMLLAENQEKIYTIKNLELEIKDLKIRNNLLDTDR